MSAQSHSTPIQPSEIASVQIAFGVDFAFPTSRSRVPSQYTHVLAPMSHPPSASADVAILLVDRFEDLTESVQWIRDQLGRGACVLVTEPSVAAAYLVSEQQLSSEAALSIIERIARGADRDPSAPQLTPLEPARTPVPPARLTTPRKISAGVYLADTRTLASSQLASLDITHVLAPRAHNFDCPAGVTSLLISSQDRLKNSVGWVRAVRSCNAGARVIIGDPGVAAAYLIAAEGRSVGSAWATILNAGADFSSSPTVGARLAAFAKDLAGEVPPPGLVPAFANKKEEEEYYNPPSRRPSRPSGLRYSSS
ncbi:hypothetical protein BC834DRAFT_847515 [Gloeopeniophorella convolvens]|nr:hypothetical protein BC834DRAFT_847515 [Gloeopeniophorella convolvens]